MDLVRKIAGRHAKSLPPWVEMDEIIAAGYLGLPSVARNNALLIPGKPGFR